MQLEEYTKYKLKFSQVPFALLSKTVIKLILVCFPSSSLFYFILFFSIFRFVFFSFFETSSQKTRPVFLEEFSKNEKKPKKKKKKKKKKNKIKKKINK